VQAYKIEKTAHLVLTNSVSRAKLYYGLENANPFNKPKS